MKVPKASKLPSGSWRIQLRLGGESISITERTEKDCVRKAELVKAEYRSGKETEKYYGITVTKAIDEFISSRANVLSPSTIKAYRSMQSHRFQSIMQRRITDSFNWQKLVDQESRLASAKTVKNSFVFIRSVFKENGIVVPDVKMPQIVKNEHPYLTWEQIPKFLDIIYGEPCEMAALLGLHSLRRSEMLAVEKSSVNNGIIHIHGSAVVGENMELIRKATNKNTTSRRDVPVMIPRLQELVDNAPDGFLITCYPTTMYNQINKLCEKNGLPKIGVHGLRHSFASLARHVGLSEQETMEIGGWADRNTMHNIYTHLDKVDRANAVNKMAAFYETAHEITHDVL